MTWTYDLATDIGKVRLLISDTDIVPVTDAHFSDEEIQVFLTIEGSVNLAAALALESWASTYSATTNSEHIGDYSYTQSITDNMLKLAERLRKTTAEIPSITWAEPDLMFEADEE